MRNDDWVGFSPIVGAATALARPTPTRDRVTDLVLGLISDLLATGVLAGDLTDSDDETFVPWAIDVPAVLVRISAEMTQLPDSRTPGTSAGSQQGPAMTPLGVARCEMLASQLAEGNPHARARLCS